VKGLRFKVEGLGSRVKDIPLWFRGRGMRAAGGGSRSTRRLRVGRTWGVRLIGKSLGFIDQGLVLGVKRIDLIVPGCWSGSPLLRPN
jgi:hypothetical protein